MGRLRPATFCAVDWEVTDHPALNYRYVIPKDGGEHSKSDSTEGCHWSCEDRTGGWLDSTSQMNRNILNLPN